jgi:hypothetical protein
MLIPVTLWVFSFWRATLSFVALVLVFFFSFNAWLWNGYMDGFLVLYAGASLLLIGRYVADRRDVDLYSAICAAGIAANLKNEGLLFGLCLLVAISVAAPGSLRRKLAHLGRRIRADRMFVATLILSVGPTAIWVIWKTTWGLQNDLTRNPFDGLVRLWRRIGDGATAPYLFRYLTTEASAIWWLTGLLMIAAAYTLRRRLTLPNGAIIAAVTALLYTAGLFAVYLTTPHEILQFYLSTSAIRTMATASISLLVGLFFLIGGLERREGDARPSTDRR